MAISDPHNAASIKFFASYAEESEVASEGKNQQELIARDNAFKRARAGSIVDGWIWNICWNAARRYYLTNNSGENLAEKKLFDKTEPETITEDQNLEDETI